MVEPPRIVACGVDTLHLAARADTSRSLTQLKRLRQESEGRSLAQPPITTHLAGVDYLVQPFGHQHGDVVLDSPAMRVIVSFRRSGLFPSLLFRSQALGLWQRGPDALVQEARQIAIELGDPLARFNEATALDMPWPQLGISRIDLACDFQGWTPTLDNVPFFVGRSRDRENYYADELTGFRFGKGPVVARLHDKSHEIRTHSHKTWFPEAVWPDSPSFDPNADVWRLELQLRREWLRDHSLVPGGPRLPVDSWRDFRLVIRDLWRHLTTSWLSLRLPRLGATRQRVDPRWAVLSDGAFADESWGKGSTSNLYRVKLRTSRDHAEKRFQASLARVVANRLDGSSETSPEVARELAGKAVDQAFEQAAERNRPIRDRATAMAQRERVEESATLGVSVTPKGGVSDKHGEGVTPRQSHTPPLAGSGEAGSEASEPSVTVRGSVSSKSQEPSS
jgi:hypothetical protein